MTFFYFQNIFLKFVLHTVSQKHLLQMINIIKKWLCCITLKTLCHDCVIYGRNHCSGPFYSNLNNKKWHLLSYLKLLYEENTWMQLQSHCTFLKPTHRLRSKTKREASHEVHMSRWLHGNLQRCRSEEIPFSGMSQQSNVLVCRQWRAPRWRQWILYSDNTDKCIHFYTFLTTHPSIKV